jgi:hypothetical protein
MERGESTASIRPESHPSMSDEATHQSTGAEGWLPEGAFFPVTVLAPGVLVTGSTLVTPAAGAEGAAGPPELLSQPRHEMIMTARTILQPGKTDIKKLLQ